MRRSLESRTRQIHRLQMRVWTNPNRIPEQPAPTNQERKMDPQVVYNLRQQPSNQ